MAELLWSDLVEMQELEELERLKTDEWEAIQCALFDRAYEWQTLVDDYFSLRKAEEKKALLESLTPEELRRLKEAEWASIMAEQKELMEDWISAVCEYSPICSQITVRSAEFWSLFPFM